MTAPVRSGKAAAAFATTLLVALSLPATARAQDKLALVGSLLLHRCDVPPLHHAVAVVEGDRIVAAGRAAELEIPADARVVDTSGRVLMPGTMDLHAHLAVLGHGEYGRWLTPRGIGGDTSLRTGPGAGHRGRRPPGGDHRRPPGVGVRGHRRIPRAPSGPAAPG